MVLHGLSLSFFGVNNLLFLCHARVDSDNLSRTRLFQCQVGTDSRSFCSCIPSWQSSFGSLSRSRDRRLWLALASVLCCLGLVGLATAPLFAPYLWVSLIAFGQAGGFTLGMTLPLDNTDSVLETDVWNAFTLTFGYLIAASGPILVGILRDRTGSFRAPTFSLVGVGVVMLLLTALLRPPSPNTIVGVYPHAQ